MRNDRVNCRAQQVCLLGPLVLLSACYSGLNEDGATAASGQTGGDGTDDGDSTGEVPPPGCEAPSVGVTDLRRLTASQYENSVRDLLAYSGDAAIGFSPDERVGRSTATSARRSARSRSSSTWTPPRRSRRGRSRTPPRCCPAIRR